jgi:hypothetical protein
MRLQPFMYRRFTLDSVGQDSAPMRAQHQTTLMQFVQIISDGYGRRIEAARQIVDSRAAFPAYDLQNLCAPLLRHHPIHRALHCWVYGALI